MGKLWKLCTVLAVGALLAAASGPARAATVPFTGTLTIEIGQETSSPILGSGTATVNESIGGALPVSSVTIPSGAFSSVVTFPTTTTIRNLQIAVSEPGVCTKDHAAVTCPGGYLAGFGGLQGTAFFGNLLVPLDKVGAGSSTVGGNVTVTGAGWTTGTVFVGGSPVGNGTRNTPTLNTGSLTLVSPIQVTGSSGAQSGIARIQLHFVPEPGTLLLVGAGAAGLALYGLRRTRV